ncbi:NUMOD3 domain-containing DNA-binding protein [Deinococcus aerophilus]
MSETSARSTKRGPEHANFGLRRSDATRARISEAASARTEDKNPFYGHKHGDATKHRIAEQKRGQQPANSRPVVADGVAYPSVTAARHLHISPALVIYRLKSLKYDYHYAESDVDTPGCVGSP